MQTYRYVYIKQFNSLYSFTDIALNLLKKYPEIARGEIADTGKILELLSKRPKEFASGSRLGFWKGLLYRCSPCSKPFLIKVALLFYLVQLHLSRHIKN